MMHMDLFNSVGDDLAWGEDESSSQPARTALVAPTPSTRKGAVTIVDDSGDETSPARSDSGIDQVVCTALAAQQTAPALSQRATPRKRRRVAATNYCPTLQAISDDASSAEIHCVFVSVKKKREPIPLWPQYSVVGASPIVGQWIMVGNYEDWFLRLTQGVGKGYRRVNAKFLKSIFHPRFREGLQKARAQLVRSADLLKDESDEDDAYDGDAGVKNLRIPFSTHPVVRVTIEGYPVTCLNSGRTCILQVDKDSIAFIAHGLIPWAINSLAHSQPETAALPSEQGQTQEQVPAPFAFSAGDTPNIRDKVAWEPMHHGWKLSVKKPLIECKPFTDETGASLCVEAALSSIDYNEDKLRTYVNALRAWNAIDGSTRHRIPLPKTA